MLTTNSFDRALKQLDQAANNLDNGNAQNWRGCSANLIRRIALALRYPGQYEFVFMAQNAQDALATAQGAEAASMAVPVPGPSNK